MHPYGPARRGGGAIAWLAFAVALLVFVPDAPSVARPARPHRAGRTTTARADRAVAFALRQVGKPYRWGADGPDAYDCSGLTFAAWRRSGVSIPRTAAGQLANLPPVHGRPQPGDLVIYATDGPSQRHVAIVVAPRRMVEARGRGIPVRVARLRNGWLGVVRP